MKLAAWCFDKENMWSRALCHDVDSAMRFLMLLIKKRDIIDLWKHTQDTQIKQGTGSQYDFCYIRCEPMGHFQTFSFPSYSWN